MVRHLMRIRRSAIAGIRWRICSKTSRGYLVISSYLMLGRWINFVAEKTQDGSRRYGICQRNASGGTVLVVASILLGEHATGPVTFNAIAAWFYLVTAGSLLAFTAYMYLLSKVHTGLAASYAYVNPVIAVALGAAFGGEHISLKAMLAMAIILGSVMVLTSSRKPAK